MSPKITLLTNASIYTMDAKTPQANALAILDGRVIATGKSLPLLLEFEGRAEVKDMHGKVVIPGLTDAHIHLQHYALGLTKVDCETATLQECLERVTARARTTPPGTWILGHGWNQNNWPEGFGNAEMLDQAAPDHPVYLTAKSLHAAWANTKAMRTAQISNETPDPIGGKLERNQEGSPTGILFESAMNLVSSAVPAPSAVDLEQAILTAIPTLHSLGLTGVHDFDRRECFLALQSLHQQDRLKLRVVKSIPLEDLPYAAGLGLSTGFGDDFLRIGSIKAFADGALGPQTAAMLKPYENDPQNRGILLLDAEELFERGRQAVEAGLSMAIHAIGDRANHEMLDGIQQLRQYEKKVRPAGSAVLRHRIEHVQVIHTDDAPRLAELGIIASMQPIHATSDMLMADRFWGERAALAYAWRTQLEHGAHIAFGSDAPVESPNPFWGLHAAVTRQRMDGSPGASGWYPEQRLTIMEALLGFTTGAAYAAGMENQLGQLSPGYLADLLVLDNDPFKCPASQLAEIKPEATMVHGEWVWQKSEILG